jgi:lipoprotein-releasing system permease protein
VSDPGEAARSGDPTNHPRGEPTGPVFKAKPGRTLDVRHHWSVPVYAGVVVLWCVKNVAENVFGPIVLYATRDLPELWFALVGKELVFFVIATMLAILAGTRTARLQPGTRGRTRVLFLTVLGPLQILMSLALLATLALALEPSAYDPISRSVPYGVLLTSIHPFGLVLIFVILALSGVAGLLLLVTLLSCWFLIPLEGRKVFWRAVDALLVAYVLSLVFTQLAFDHLFEPLFFYEVIAPIRVAPAVVVITGLVAAIAFAKRARPVLEWVLRLAMLGSIVAAIFVLQLEVPEEAPEVLVPALVSVIALTLLGVRTHWRWIPVVMDLIELAGFRPLVASRHLRAKKSDFLAVIGVLSILAVMVSSAALVMVLSVMGGFRNDLKRKILGNHAHVVIDKEHATFTSWEPILARARDAEHVIGASPYVSGEVMVTSASNLSSAVLRGIDPEAIETVSELRSNLTSGRLEYLRTPERLLHLPPEETRGPMPLEIPSLWQREEEPREPDTGVVRDIDEILNEPSGTDTPGEPSEGTEGLDAPPVLGPDPPVLAPDPPELGQDPLVRRDEMLENVPDPTQARPIDEVLGPEPVTPAREVLPGIIVGRELARALRLYLGDEVNVVSPFGDLGPAGPMPKSRPFRVAGIFYSGMYEYDMKYMYVTLETGQRFLNTGEGISGIEIKVDEIERAPEVADSLRGSLGRDDLRVQDWQKLNQNLFGALELEKLAMFITLGLAILVAGFCVFGTLTLMVQEKGREVGILKAMGASELSIVAIFLLEGTLIGFFGAELGLGLGYVACFAAEHFGIGMNPEVYYIDRLPVHTDLMEFGAVALAAVGVCLLATVFPAFLASRLRPVEAMRYD